MRMDTPALQIDGIEIHIEGPADGEVVVMIHGWPDTWRLWDAQVAALSPTRRCVRFTLPGFDIDHPRPAPTLDGMVAFFAEVVDTVSPDRPVVLMLHDWGCVFGLQYALRHAQRVSRVVAADVGDSGSPAVSAGQTWGQRWRVANYQLKLALAWYVGGARGDRMTRRMAQLQRAPTDVSLISASMNAPYAMRRLGARGGFKNALPARPAWPTLFIWGTRKTMMFHSADWIADLEARGDCRIVGIEAGHWMMVTRAKEFNAAVLDWLGSDAASRSH